MKVHHPHLLTREKVLAISSWIWGVATDPVASSFQGLGLNGTMDLNGKQLFIETVQCLFGELLTLARAQQ